MACGRRSTGRRRSLRRDLGRVDSRSEGLLAGTRGSASLNTSTAFNPTDTAFLSRRAKALMMVQALLSLLILAVLVSRAINTLAAA